MRTRLKICGITSVKDAHLVIDAGADAIGLVFYPKSPRAVAIAQAKAIVDVVPAFVQTVGLFVNAQPEQVAECIEKTNISLLQFHGDETAEVCEQFNHPYIKGLRVGGAAENSEVQQIQDIARKIEQYPSAKAVLLDTYVKGIPGGTGEQFNWNLIPEVDKPIILAGGLTSENVRAAAQLKSCYAVDVSGGVESSPGSKDAARIRAFTKALWR